MKTCIGCGSVYQPTGNNQKFCSRACRGEAVCERCDKVFVPTKKSKGRFCSTECFYEMSVPTGSVIQDRNGYLLEKVPKGTFGTKRTKDRTMDRWMWQHRYVMQQQLGRPLLPHENVHHKNGDKTDNRPENLELWVRRQPYGQRLEDLLDFVVEFYTEELRCRVN